ncbi:2030_t:CDS:2 [Ambispora gerdemannii]|uniref:2030_t:CDS:1 n=1 Tax=Ambispora gerdemannii TaxID=144530 RepID=A0A9N8V8K9_9GLOM|nr:2030_t:CDS:2 [Ambispora gerdemannii]
MALYEGILQRDRYYLAKAITLVESSRSDHKIQAQQLLSLLLDAQNKIMHKDFPSVRLYKKLDADIGDTNKKITYRIGLSGPPGVGKSTFIEAFGMHVLSKGHRVAVLAVDPSSPRTGGSIMGDKTRMPQLSHQEDAYVRPSPTRGTLAAGYDVILVETVGVGQSEIMVSEMVDMFVLIVPPAGGDEIQGLKKGIVEIADLVIVNKADGQLANAAKEAAAEYKSALKYLKPTSSVWMPKVIPVSAKTKMGINDVWDAVKEYFLKSSECERKRGTQRKLWMWRQVTSELLERFKSESSIRTLVNELDQKLFRGEITSGAAADLVVDRFINKK